MLTRELVPLRINGIGRKSEAEINMIEELLKLVEGKDMQAVRKAL